MKKSLVSSIIIVGIFSQIITTSIYAQDIISLEVVIHSNKLESHDIPNASNTEEFIQISQSIDTINLDQTSMYNTRQAALSYIEGLEPYDQHWTGKTPKLLGKPVPYYTDDESEPLVYEWKIACKNNKDCGSIMIATLDGVSRVMEASTYGTTNYERLGKGKTSKKNKFYYYSPFDQYVESRDILSQNGVTTLSDTISVEALDPGKQLKLSSSEKRTELTERKEQVKKVRKGGKLQFENTQETSVSIGGATVNISNTSVGICGGPLPCYGQFTSTAYAGANNAPCYSGCGPTALAIIFGYYDRIGKFPNLVGNSSVLASDTSIDITMVNTIRGYMGTQCSATISPDGTRGGETGFTSEGLGMQYARDRGYTASSNGVYTTGSIASMPIIMAEINAGRPVIVNYTSTSGHIMAVYGYQTNPNMVHVNFGWAGVYADKYIPVSLIAVTSTQAGAGNPIIGMKFHSVVTVPIK